MSKTEVKIKHQASGKLVPATLINGVSIRQADLTQRAWDEALMKYLEGIPKKDWPEHTGWDWKRKYKKYGRLSAYHFFGIECNSVMQGLLLLSTLFRTSRIDDGKQIIYGAYLATAPWNLRQLTNNPQYSLVGSVLVAAAIETSRGEGCAGRFGLHSLKQSEQFYRSCGMSDLGVDRDHNDRLRYFEMTTLAAEKFLPE